MTSIKITFLHDFNAAVSKVTVANDGICVLVSALSLQGIARTRNQKSCDYCGEKYSAPGPLAWASHNCAVLNAAETIISGCVRDLLKERFIAKSALERYLPEGNERVLLRRVA